MTKQANYFPTPNEIFSLGLSPGEFAVYSYLLRCENRRTHQCWPSYKTIGTATKMSVNTVRKHICSLADKGLISTEDTVVYTRNGRKRNGSLLYTIQPIQEVRTLTGKVNCESWRSQQRDGNSQKLCRCKQKKTPCDHSRAAVWPRS